MAVNRVVAKLGWSVKLAKYGHRAEEPFPEGAHVTLDEDRPGRVTIVSTAPSGASGGSRASTRKTTSGGTALG